MALPLLKCGHILGHFSPRDCARGRLRYLIYIIKFVCLFVRDSRLNYAKYSHQSLRDYIDPPGRTTPRIGVTRPVVSMAFPVYFRYSLCGRPPYFNYGLLAFPVFTRVLLQQAAFEILTNGIPEYTQAKRIYLKGMTKIGR